MRVLWGLILLVSVGVTISAPVERKDDHSKELQDIRGKLANLEKTLKALQGNIDDYVKHDGNVRKHSKEEAINRKVREFEDRLSPEDNELINKFQSKLGYLRAALDAPVGPNENDIENQDIETRSVDSDLQDFVQTLSPEDQQLLGRVHSKLRYLEEELAKKNVGPNPGETEGEFADINEQDRIKEQQSKVRGLAESLNTNSRESEDSILIDVRANLDRLRGALDKYSMKRALNKDRGCKNGNCKSSEQAVQDVSRRFLNDVRYAKSKGINLQELLQALENQRNKRQNPQVNSSEQELQGLVGS